MQVFIVGTPLETAIALDNKRLWKQIIETRQILDALNGKKAWSNHPCTLQYRKHKEWLELYMYCLDEYRKGFIVNAEYYNNACNIQNPPFHTQEYFDQMKRRLYTKDNEHYKQWESLGESDVNWYFVDDEWRKYVNGKRI